MNIITKHVHIWRLAIAIYKCEKIIKYKNWHCKYSCIIFGHAVRIY